MEGPTINRRGFRRFSRKRLPKQRLKRFRRPFRPKKFELSQDHRLGETEGASQHSSAQVSAVFTLEIGRKSLGSEKRSPERSVGGNRRYSQVRRRRNHPH